MTKFSIIVVSLNTKKDFIKTIQSIKKQKYKNYEIVIIDGKSSDGTIEVIKVLKSKNIKFIIEKDNGIYDAMNKGIKNSKGDWIIFLNSGDIFYNNSTLKMIAQQNIDNQDILFGDTIIDNYDFNYLVKANNFTKNTYLMPFCHQSSLVKKKLIQKIKFDKKYKIASDFNFFIKCFNKKKLFFNLDMVISKISAKGLSDKNRNKVFNENIKILSTNNYSFFLILKLWQKKIFNFLNCILKLILPKFCILYLLKVKYSKYVISKN